MNFVRNLEVAAPRGEILDSGGQILASSQRAYAVKISPPEPAGAADRRHARPSAAEGRGAVQPARPRGRAPDQAAAVPGRDPGLDHASRPHERVPHVADRLRGRAGLRAAAVRPGDGGDRHHQAAALVPVRASVLVPGRQRPAGLPARLSVRRRRVAGARDRQPDHARRDQAEPYFSGVSQNDSVGQSGLEASYDRYLRGVDGAERVKVDALGNFDGSLSETPPTPGENLKLSLNAKLEAVGQQSLQDVDRLELPGAGRRVRGDEPDQRRDLRDGLAADLQRERVHEARPVFGVQLVVRTELRRSAGEPRLPERRADRLDVQVDHRDGGARKRRLDRRRRLRRHRPVLHLRPVPPQRRQRGRRLARSRERDQGLLGRLLLQPRRADELASARTAARCSTGRASTGSGARPASTSRARTRGRCRRRTGGSQRNQLEAECDNATGPFKGKPKHAPGGCGIADGTNRPWSIGDNISLAVGQGDVQVTPLQLAVVVLDDRQRRHGRHARTSGSTCSRPTGSCCGRSIPVRSAT